MITTVRLLLCWTILLCAPAFGATAATIGGVAVVLPSPAGYMAPTENAGAMIAHAESVTPPTNRLLAAFFSPEDVAAVAAGNAPQMTRYFYVQTMRSMEAATFSAKDFSDVRDALRREQHDMLTRYRDGIQENLDSIADGLSKKLSDPTIAIKVGESVPRGIFRDQDNAFGFASLVKLQFVIGGKKVEAPMAIAMTAVRVKGKLIFLFAYSLVHSAADETWTQASADAWTSSVLAAN
jgi:hypothetical protein